MKLFRRPGPRSLPVPPKVAAERERARPKRILVIGSDGHARSVDSYRWDKLPAAINVADYDVTILNFAAFAEDEELAEGFPPERLPSRELMTRLLFAPKSETIAIGSWGAAGCLPALADRRSTGEPAVAVRLRVHGARHQLYHLSSKLVRSWP